MLIIIFGDIGVGKSTLARALGERFGFRLVQFDPLVPSVTGKEKMYGENGEFLLSDEEIDAVHAKMRENARGFLLAGESVIMESMFFKEQREKAIELSEGMGISYHLVRVVCDEEENKRRVEKRLAENKQSAGVELLLENKGLLDNEVREHITLDTTDKTTEECLNEISIYIN